MKNVYKVSDFLLPEELDRINHILTDDESWGLRSQSKEDPALGRLMFTIFFPDGMLDSIRVRVENLIGRSLPLMNGMFVTYQAKYGQPNLPPHFDGDNNDLIIDYQYKSNTSWGLGVDTTVYDMKDNDAIIFNPNEYPHWRPHKTFKDDEFVTMIFFRFPDEENVDYSHMRYSQDHEIFSEARKVRDSLKSEGMAE